MNAVDIKDIPGITYYKTNDLEIEFLDPPKTSWCIDGEEYTSPNEDVIQRLIDYVSVEYDQTSVYTDTDEE